MAKLFLGNREVSASKRDRCNIKKAVDNGKLVKSHEMIDLTGVDTIGENALAYAYYEDTTITEIPDFSNIVTIKEYGCQYMFYGCTNLTGTVSFKKLVNLPTSWLGNHCQSMFYNCTGITSVDLSNFKQINFGGCFGYMFSGCTGLTSIDLHNVEYITGQSACSGMFSGCTSLTNVDLHNLIRISYGSTSGMFNGCTNLKTVDLSNLIFAAYSSYGTSNMFQNCTSLESIDIHKLTALQQPYSMFNNCRSLTSIDLSNLLEMFEYGTRMFENCTSLVSIDLSNLTKFMSNTYFSNIFYGCTSLKSVNFSWLDEMTNNNAFNNAFEGCTSLENVYFRALDENSFGNNRGQFTNMFKGCIGTTLHFPINFDPDDPNKVFDVTTLSGYPAFGGTNISVVFDQVLPSFRSLDLSYISKIDMSYFLSSNYGHIKRYKNLVSVDLSGVKEITANQGCCDMFNGCTTLQFVDLSSVIDIPTSNQCNYMFGNCTSLETVYLDSLEKVNAATMFINSNIRYLDFPSLVSITSLQNCFMNCTNLKDLRFWALKNNSFVNNRALSSMLNGCDGVIIHFPLNLDPQTGSTAVSSLVGYPNFSGINTTLMFDLPMTE